MAKTPEQTGFYDREYRLLAGAKEILNQPGLSRDELKKEFAGIVAEYETLLKHAAKQAHSPDRPLSEADVPAKQPEEILEMKSRLFTHITHEFLTPLNLVITPLEQMLSQCRDQEQRKKLSLMYRNSQRLFLIINQVLELFKLESRRLKLKAGLQDIIPFLKGITASFELLAEQNEVSLIFAGGKESILLYFDPEKMAEVTCSLLMNAVRLTPPGGGIRVSVRQLPPGEVEISLHNTGSGAPIEQKKSTFDNFYQLKKRSGNYIKDFDIGLFLARNYIELHHGAIYVNNGEGEGTEFVIRLPQGKTHLKPEEIEEMPVSPAEEAGCKISKHYAYMMQLEREEREEAESSGSETVAEEKNGDIVLVIEDNADMRGFIKNLLTVEHFIVEVAVNGRQGIDMAKEIIPDIIISDIMMPDANGYQVCRELKQDVETSHIPIILLSVKFAEDEVVKGLEAGADDYITKPFNMEILLTRVKNLIKMRRQLQQRVQWDTVVHPDELGLSSLDDRLLKDIQEAIEKNLSDADFSVDELADILSMSRASLHRKVTALTGQPPGKFVQSYRLKRSLDLLKANYGSITEVALKTGFSNPAYFTKRFKEKFKRLPSDYSSH
ncbi:MAG: response regulator [Candidatus Aminicenantes bacterium]|nr:response regulator [Candidatus Aminicenantes bacterium]